MNIVVDDEVRWSIDFLYMTGDLIAHNIWETTREENIKQIRDQAALFYEVLGKNIKIFPVLGNHEPHPANILAPPKIENYSGEWLYEAFFDSWCKHFPSEAKSTFMKGGYYTVTPTPGFRIIGLNSLFGYVFNWWMILDPKDPADQLQWLRDTLLLAETRREKVHILMHGPSVETDTLQVWNREYNRIIERFQSTIVGQFLGHTHRDQFYVYYSPRTNKPVSVAWNGGSVTPFTNVNPNYRIYTIHKQTLVNQRFIFNAVIETF
ncbi:sphingomyelin phosphodiesterase-like [Homalodisca vitripennis]|uniref:sphingomyelin phosphodiesterase-like n=1 Tax=Homalodisca vitripennis TaxID=197043 RepID=UPI001EEA8DBB|nr:sphingomyelin phosphodiesterase-like [Homalodisca vitripennis]